MHPPPLIPTLFPYTTLFRSGDPVAGRVCCAAGQVDASATEFDEEEHVQSLQRDRLDSEEVDREHARGRLLHYREDRKSTRLNSSHPSISYAVFRLKKKTPDL